MYVYMITWLNSYHKLFRSFIEVTHSSMQVFYIDFYHMFLFLLSQVHLFLLDSIHIFVLHGMFPLHYFNSYILNGLKCTLNFCNGWYFEDYKYYSGPEIIMFFLQFRRNISSRFEVLNSSPNCSLA